MQNGNTKYGIIQASNNNATAPFEQTVSPSFRPPQPNSSPFKPENFVSNGPRESNDNIVTGIGYSE